MLSLKSLEPHLVSLKAPTSFAAEQYQGLRMTVERLKLLRDMHVVGVTSPGAGDGKTVTSINLAVALSRGSDARVLLIDADLRRPAVAERLGLADAGAGGLIDTISGKSTIQANLVRQVNGLNLDVLPAGVTDAPIHEILRAPRLADLLQEARRRYDFVVLDTPPLLPVFDAAYLSKLVDGLLVVVSANKTPRKLLEEALNMLDAAKVVGLVFNGDDRPLFGYYDSSYRRYFHERAGLA